MFWGKLALINLYGCDSKLIKNKESICCYIKKLCQEINMELYGRTIVKRFGGLDLEGFSAFQFIKTSSITLHFDEIQNRAFIDIFSCKNFDEDLAEEFSKFFFKAKRSKKDVLIRK